MRNWEVHFHQPKNIKELMETATVVVDTNVLLSVYQWRNVTVEEVLAALEALSAEKRLKVPYQVVKEFTKRRPQILKERINEIEVTLSSLKRDNKQLIERVPMFEAKDVLSEAQEKQKAYNNALNGYQESLKNLRNEVKALFINDPYLTRIKNILSNSFFDPDIEKSEKELEDIAQKRFENKIPPGYKDNKKEENNSGDYIIWHYILHMNNDVIFISNDKKPDWVYQDNHEMPISARRELVEEFYNESGGKDFIHLSPKEFIPLYNPNLSEDVKEDLNKQVILQSSFKTYNNINPKLFTKTIAEINAIFRTYNPYQFKYQEGYITIEDGEEYLSLAKSIYLRFLEHDKDVREVESIVSITLNPERLNISKDKVYEMINEIDNILYDVYLDEKLNAN